MGKNLVQKILDSHIVDGASLRGSEVGIKIDQTLTQDATGTMAYLQFEALGFDRVKTELSVSYVDHNTIQEGFENSDDHAYLESIAQKFGILYSKAGNGICHQVHLERFGQPGKTLVGSDSHTPTGGGIGMIAIGAGGLDVAVAMGGGAFYINYPTIINIQLLGTLRPWVAAKDIILKVLEIISTKGNVGCILEYSGPGIASLSVPQRSTITNMGAETGATTSIFPSDEQTKAFLAAQGRMECYKPLSADPDATYDRTITIDLDTLEPLMACPHSPGNIKTVKELAGTKVDQVIVGSCTNSSYRDLMVVATALAGKRVAPGVSFGVAPGSHQVLSLISRNGGFADIVEGGARILESACGFCIGNSMAPKTNGVSLRTNNRNFLGRSGTDSAQVYIVSPETAVASALAGEIVDPREYFKDFPYPDIAMPNSFKPDDSMILLPSQNPESIELVRGPNIGAPPTNTPLPQSVQATIAVVLGDKITTDHIMPAGSRLKYRSNITKYSDFVFEKAAPGFAAKALDLKAKGIPSVIVAGESYGQGSSREHAAICPMYLGVKVVLAKSIERIHKANLINFGIVPALFKNPADYDTLGMDDVLVLDNIRSIITSETQATIVNTTKQTSFVVDLDFTPRERKYLLAGGLIQSLKS